ncbi:MAG TPA: hydrogenase, partial [Clostridia bacterium]|nr:hydrogenase [Clostridia bacterium]
KTLAAIGGLVVLGVVLNRFNVALVGMAGALGQSYFPSWMEISITAMLVSLGVLAYTFIAENFNLFAVHGEAEAEETGKAARAA